ncbi:hypothetical protein OX284_005085 [Flavobacterium sp. SUN046]|jgi:hypothetical protein|uniref:hypothetical protein n=1 Tax=Flavobacterium sp. SUN046 TaxID=3002440 RepID=UPI002DB86EEE|nr:hypothetical protein [Flavobacterium sp. SUN046]MEC4048795.1 hypothetical protein [Flavobacterium sp. SUN046]
MKKLVSIVAVAAFLFSVNVNAQEAQQKDKKAKTEKTCSKDEKKGCDKDKKGGSCCAHKK